MTAPAEIALYVHPDGYLTEGRPLMGRRAAGKSFLEAWIAATPADRLVFYADDERTARLFRDLAGQRHGQPTGAVVPRAHPDPLAAIGTLYWPTPGIEVEARRRAMRRPAGWSLMGITHTTASLTVMDELAALPVGSVRDHDAIICTSRAVLASIERVLDVAEEHLRRRLGATRFERPQLPVIPLGVDVDAFGPDPALRAATRARLGIADGDVAVLFLGRLSFHAKAHHVPLCLALERVAQRRQERLHLIWCGWFANDFIERGFREAAPKYCPSVTVHVVDGRDEDAKAGAWRAADIFTSLVDNVQETFGLSPVEAMAAGLPGVVSDWDGYRDTVRDGIDGFRVPTFAPGPDGGWLAIDRHHAGLDTYDRYLQATTLDVVVDVAAAAGAFETLVASPALRATMGEGARKRAREVYDWSKIIVAYRALAAELAERRAVAARTPEPPRPVAARLSPFDVFAGYPRHRLGPGTRLALDPAAPADRLVVVLADPTAPLDPAAKALVPVVMDLLAAGPVPLADVTTRAAADAAAVGRAARWLAKFGFVRAAP